VTEGGSAADLAASWREAGPVWRAGGMTGRGGIANGGVVVVARSEWEVPGYHRLKALG